MKNDNGNLYIFQVLAVPLLLLFYSADSQPFNPASGKEITLQQWVNGHFAKGVVPPFSFRYGGVDSRAFITGWKYSMEKLATESPEIKRSVYIYTDSRTGLTVRCLVTWYTDFPAVEWVVKFRNTSGSNSPVIEMAQAADLTFRYRNDGRFILHHSLGSDASRYDFQPVDESLKIGETISLMPAGGRSSDKTALPFFNIEAPDSQGTIVAVGWTGRWHADITRKEANSVDLRAGIAKMHLILFPGEEIRTPSVSLLFWKANDPMEGHNHFRQFILAHHSRKVNGKFAEYPLSGSFDYGDPPPCNEYSCLTADYAIAIVRRYKQFKAVPEVFWLDAGWYTGCGWDKGEWWQNVGNWTPEKDRFPDGLKPIADEVHSVGSKFMVWFEPERVRKGTQFDQLNPDWLIRIPGNDNTLYNLGNTDARLWLTDYITDFIKKEGIDYYRQDFNFDPLPFWESNDKPDRVGISEIRHIEGLYAYWDSLLVRFPNLLIDNCASGGRRLDIETTTRSAPLWRTDYQYGEPNGYQCHTYGLNFYLPIHGTAIYKSENYTFRSGLDAAAVINWEISSRNSESIPAMQKAMEEFKKLRPYYYGDYYPLTGTENMTMDNVWLAYQLSRPLQNDGIILAFRRKDCKDDSIIVKMHRIDSDRKYELLNEDTSLTETIPGEELKKGYRIKLTDQPGSVLIFYKKIE